MCFYVIIVSLCIGLVCGCARACVYVSQDRDGTRVSKIAFLQHRFQFFVVVSVVVAGGSGGGGDGRCYCYCCLAHIHQYAYMYIIYNIYHITVAVIENMIRFRTNGNLPS